MRLRARVQVEARSRRARKSRGLAGNGLRNR